MKKKSIAEFVCYNDKIDNDAMIQLIDTHAHLCDPQFDSDREDVLKRAKENGVEVIIEVSDSPINWEKTEDFSKVHSMSKESPVIYWTCGFHPHHAEEGVAFDFERMRKSANRERCLAIGEVGLDYYKSSASGEIQIVLFEKSLQVAVSLKKPVIIHCRDAQEDVMKILKSFYEKKSDKNYHPGVIHCFSGDLSYAETCLQLGFYIGIDGPLTYPNAKNLREVISKIPLERIVLETDAPYLPPQSYRGKRNESAYLPLIAQELALIFKKDLQEIVQITSNNARKLFGIKENG